MLQISTSPARSALVNALEGLRRTSPSLVQQFLPVLDQLEPIFSSLSNGTSEFVPHPEETAEQLRTQYGATKSHSMSFPAVYLRECLNEHCSVFVTDNHIACSMAGVPRNLIIQFSNDTIDESPRLNSVLEANSTVARELRYKVRSLRGSYHSCTSLVCFGGRRCMVKHARSQVYHLHCRSCQGITHGRCCRRLAMCRQSSDRQHQQSSRRARTSLVACQAQPCRLALARCDSALLKLLVQAAVAICCLLSTCRHTHACMPEVPAQRALHCRHSCP